MDDYDDLAKAAMEFLDGKITEEMFISTPSPDSEPNSSLTLDSILEAKAKIDTIWPLATQIRVPMGLYWKISLKAQESPPNAGWLIDPPPGGIFGGIAIRGDWGLSHHYVTEFSDGSREVRWCP